MALVVRPRRTIQGPYSAPELIFPTRSLSDPSLGIQQHYLLMVGVVLPLTFVNALREENPQGSDRTGNGLLLRLKN